MESGGLHPAGLLRGLSNSGRCRHEIHLAFRCVRCLDSMVCPFSDGYMTMCVCHVHSLATCSLRLSGDLSGSSAQSPIVLSVGSAYRDGCGDRWAPPTRYHCISAGQRQSCPEHRVASWTTGQRKDVAAVSYTHLRAHETVLDLVCRL